MGLGLSCSEAGGIFLDQGSNPYFDVYLLEPPGKPTLRFLSKGLFSACYQHHQRKETKIGSLMKVSIPPVGNTLEVKCASLVAQLKNPPAIWETWVRSLGREDPLEKGTATHSSILAWRTPWTLKSMGSQRVDKTE